MINGRLALRARSAALAIASAFNRWRRIQRQRRKGRDFGFGGHVVPTHLDQSVAGPTGAQGFERLGNNARGVLGLFDAGRVFAQARNRALLVGYFMQMAPARPLGTGAAPAR